MGGAAPSWAILSTLLFSAWFSVGADAATTTNVGRCDTPTGNCFGTSLLQVSVGSQEKVATQSFTRGMLESTENGCADLKMENNGTFYTTVLKIGTPAQEFSVVVDTGSNSIIVPSCVCNDAGYCGNESACFRGTNKSSTFTYPGQHDQKNIEAMMITFGSGTIEAIRAMDVVTVGGLTAKMEDGVLLMTNQALQFSGRFEGILGLGIPPRSDTESNESRDYGRHQQIERHVTPYGDGVEHHKSGYGQDITDEDIIEQLAKAITTASDKANLDSQRLGLTQEDPNDILKDILDKLRKGGAQQPKPKERPPMMHQPKSFLEQAGIDRFSLCFDRDDGGMLRMGHVASALDKPLKNIGVEHWGLAFHGIGVGENAHDTSPLFCSSSNMSDSQTTPCGIIPDSGTTAIMGPKHQVSQLFESICDNWPRCQKNHSALLEAAEAAKAAATAQYGFSPWTFDTTGATKSDILKLLLADCGSWMSPDGGLENEGLPELSFFVRGGDGDKRTLKISPMDYIVSMMQEDLEYSMDGSNTEDTETIAVPGFGKIPVGVNHTGKFQKVCMASISDMEYNTERNGPVWILGVPLFQTYSVGYDLKQQGISFASLQDGECGTCKSANGLVSQERSVFTGKQTRQRTRGLKTIRQPPRMPNIDVTRPL